LHGSCPVVYLNNVKSSFALNLSKYVLHFEIVFGLVFQTGPWCEQTVSQTCSRDDFKNDAPLLENLAVPF
jgi:hypothetical protein